MEHEMKLKTPYYYYILNGTKRIEIRLNDEKRQRIKIGDTIKFIKLPDKDEFLYADVSNIEVFKDWYTCYAKYFDEDFRDRYETIQDVVDDTYNGGYYSKENSLKYGCCCITLDNIKKNTLK